MTSNNTTVLKKTLQSFDSFIALLSFVFSSLENGYNPKCIA